MVEMNVLLEVRPFALDPHKSPVDHGEIDHVLVSITDAGARGRTLVRGIAGGASAIEIEIGMGTIVAQGGLYHDRMRDEEIRTIIRGKIAQSKGFGLIARSVERRKFSTVLLMNMANAIPLRGNRKKMRMSSMRSPFKRLRSF